MYKVVYNNCYGGFALSAKAIDWLQENGSDEVKNFITDLKNKCNNSKSYDLAVKYGVVDYFNNKRHHKDLIAVVETLGKEANAEHSDLQIKQSIM